MLPPWLTGATTPDEMAWVTVAEANPPLGRSRMLSHRMRGVPTGGGPEHSIPTPVVRW